MKKRHETVIVIGEDHTEPYARQLVCQLVPKLQNEFPNTQVVIGLELPPGNNAIEEFTALYTTAKADYISSLKKNLEDKEKHNTQGNVEACNIIDELMEYEDSQHERREAEVASWNIPGVTYQQIDSANTDEIKAQYPLHDEHMDMRDEHMSQAIADTVRESSEDIIYVAIVGRNHVNGICQKLDEKGINTENITGYKLYDTKEKERHTLMQFFEEGHIDHRNPIEYYEQRMESDAENMDIKRFYVGEGEGRGADRVQAAADTCFQEISTKINTALAQNTTKATDVEQRSSTSQAETSLEIGPNVSRLLESRQNNEQERSSSR